MNRYDTDPVENEVLPNKLGLTSADEINVEEAAGFHRAENHLIDILDERTLFDTRLLKNIHKDALEHLYDFAGKLRSVNMSKGGFLFVAAEFLSQNLEKFSTEYLDVINSGDLIGSNNLRDHLAKAHAELLYIHPFREGNGRVVRLFTKLIFLGKTGEILDFKLITEGRNFDRYIAAIQQAASNEYDLMVDLFREMCP